MNKKKIITLLLLLLLLSLVFLFLEKRSGKSTTPGGAGDSPAEYQNADPVVYQNSLDIVSFASSSLENIESSTEKEDIIEYDEDGNVAVVNGVAYDKFANAQTYKINISNGKFNKTSIRVKQFDLLEIAVLGSSDTEDTKFSLYKKEDESLIGESDKKKFDLTASELGAYRGDFSIADKVSDSIEIIVE